MDLRGAQCVPAAEDAALEGDDGGMADRETELDQRRTIKCGTCW